MKTSDPRKTRRKSKELWDQQESRSIRGIDIGDRHKSASKCAKNLRLFCERYLGERFALKWSEDHLRCITKLQTAVLDGGQFAFAMPRASGKTSLSVAASLWCVLYGHRRFVVMIGATDSAAVELLDSLKVEVESNPRIGEHFKDVCDPVRALEGIALRARGQFGSATGERTRIEWTDSQVVLPMVKKRGKWTGSSGATVRTVGITGRIRGMNHATADGKTIRPDLVILDDPQTDESATSPIQNAKRENIISKAVLGMAGPKVKIAAVMPCTVIAPRDMADRALDRDLHPEWNGERTKLLYSEPTNTGLWDRYAELRRESLQAGAGIKRATEFYRANREAMDVGARVAWRERFKPDELSAIQCAMNLKLANYRAFRAEYQNDPEGEDFGADSKEYNPDLLAARFSGTERYLIPRETSRLTCGIDCHGKLHWYTVIAWTESGGGTIVDYGCWPRQSRSQFEMADARPALSDMYKGHTESQLVFAGLRDLCTEVLGRTYYRENGGEVTIERALVDSGWQTSAVYQFIRQCPYRAILLPSKGVGRTTTARGVGEWPKRPGEQVGYNWKLTVSEKGKGRSILFDPDPWKSLLHERLTIPQGGHTALTLHGKSASAHALISEHLAAEYSTPATLRGQTFDKWAGRPDRPDNHLLDTVVLAAVAASFAGLQWVATGKPPEPPQRAQPISLLSAQKQARGTAPSAAGRQTISLRDQQLANRRGRR